MSHSNSSLYTLVSSPDHMLEGHPESPRRFQFFDQIFTPPLSESLRYIEPVSADLGAVTSVHPENYVQALEQAAQQGPAFVDYGDTYVTPASYQAALLAAGGLLEIVSRVAGGEAKRGFALVRPPGHHATFTKAMGFCLLNNIAIAARHAQSLGMERVLIVDFDVHHGNGTQDIFERDPQVFYLSTHQSGIYPGTGFVEETGIDAGENTIVNVPLPPRAGDEAFARIFMEILEPLCEHVTPDLILVSAGFDAHWNDPLAGLQLTTSGYHRLAELLKSYADVYSMGRIVYCLEGGYDPEALRDNVRAVLLATQDLALEDDRLGPAPFPEPTINSLVERIRSQHSL
ncbi:MAG: histone deacetylase [Anaerolineales bacterium]